jgi:benzoyl-CoA reductase/2-hydroxyglutaryl-CoA dehydratase subunit BcrC/BadD/HgdB
MSTRQIMEELAQYTRTRPDKLRTLKQKNLKLIGHTGRFVPEELIYACGAVPYLMCKGGDPEPQEAVLPYMIRFVSPFARTQIGYHLMGLDPVMPMLDLIVAQCDDCHMSRLADLLEYFKLPTAKIGIPPDWEKEISFEYYYKGLIKLKEKLEILTGNKISDQKLRESIDALNRIRELLKKISLLRIQESPPIGGYDFIRLNHYSFYCDLDELCKKLNELYEQLLKNERRFSNEALRVLLAGRVVGVGDYVIPRLIEDSGGVIVAELLDEGMRHCLWNVKTEGDLVRGLAETYYLERIPPSIFQPAWAKRIEFLKKQIEEFNVDAVVWYQLSFEEIYDMEFSVLSKAIEEMKIPLLKVESSYEYSREAMGPLVTRIESFVGSSKKKRRN